MSDYLKDRNAFCTHGCTGISCWGASQRQGVSPRGVLPYKSLFFIGLFARRMPWRKLLCYHAVFLSRESARISSPGLRDDRSPGKGFTWKQSGIENRSASIPDVRIPPVLFRGQFYTGPKDVWLTWTCSCPEPGTGKKTDFYQGEHP